MGKSTPIQDVVTIFFVTTFCSIVIQFFREGIGDLIRASSRLRSLDLVFFLRLAENQLRY